MTSTTYNNMTQEVSFSLVSEHIKIFLYVLVFIFFSLFLFFISLILHIFFSTPSIREHARYILFAHMLINDSLHLVDGLCLLIVAVNAVYIPFPICYVFVSMATVSFRVTPYNLVVMALERYAAICFPLTHVTLCSPRRSKFAIAIIWFLGLLPNIVDCVILSTSVNKKIFSLSIICSRKYVIVSQIQSLLSSIFLFTSLVLAGLIIAFTYIRVMYIAKNMSSNNGSASKAGKTVMLHAVQFLLCLFSLTSSVFEERFRSSFYQLSLVNFLIFVFLPRFLSPIIYGLRDQALCKCMRSLQIVRVLLPCTISGQS
ncbi:odorant receptor 131-2-like [Bufo gargarizans]|uniref:odorant receptor 131-2-like n=1 Tax=Bufo gargarizans TaxID=30331 RepID=UPI001CF11A41|nr:odorant receptor 131-2-like [Bufo gargarizans]